MGSESDIPSADLDIMGTVSNDMNQWISNLKAETVCKTHKEVTKEKLMSHSKETLANCLLKGYQTVQSHIDKFESSSLCGEVEVGTHCRSAISCTVAATVIGHSSKRTEHDAICC